MSSTRNAGLFAGMAVVAVLVGLMAFMLGRNIGLERAAPPIEELTVQRVELPAPGVIRLHVVNGGPDPVTVAQVVIDDAIWAFDIEPGATINRLRNATIEIGYPWVQDEAHEIVLISSTGVTFDAGIDVATPSPQATLEWFWKLGLLGFYIGVVPVALGLATYPFLKRLGSRGIDFLLALTVGLLVFLAFDTIAEALELASEVPGAFHAPILVWIVAAATVVGLLAFTERRRAGGGELSVFGLATMIAIGIGLHNFGEGLAVGAALATGAVGLGTFLIVGFALHNLTEGIGIAAPLLRSDPTIPGFAMLALIAGGPAILGAWIGGFVFSPFWAALFLAVGSGAILQVVYEVGRLVARRTGDEGVVWRGEVLAGAALGILIMYTTALVVPA